MTEGWSKESNEIMRKGTGKKEVEKWRRQGGGKRKGIRRRTGGKSWGGKSKEGNNMR